MTGRGFKSLHELSLDRARGFIRKKSSSNRVLTQIEKSGREILFIIQEEKANDRKPI